jgi:hypothetical protein
VACVCYAFQEGSSRAWMAHHTRSGVAGIATSATPSGASASRIAFITVGVAATVPPSPTPLDAERVRQARHRAEIGRDRPQVIGARDGVINQRSRPVSTA